MIYLSITDIVYDGCFTNAIKDRRASVSWAIRGFNSRSARSMTVVKNYYEFRTTRRVNTTYDNTFIKFEYSAPPLSFVTTGRGPLGKNGSVSNARGPRLGLQL